MSIFLIVTIIFSTVLLIGWIYDKYTREYELDEEIDLSSDTDGITFFPEAPYVEQEKVIDLKYDPKDLTIPITPVTISDVVNDVKKSKIVQVKKTKVTIPSTIIEVPKKRGRKKKIDPTV